MNQDHYLIADLQRSMVLCDTSLSDEHCLHFVGNEPGKLLVVADGMGGQTGGERASSIAVQAVGDYVLNMMRWFLKLSDDREDDFREELAAALSACEGFVRKDGQEHPEFANMGTTVTLAYIVWPRMYVVHAGDSRCYVLRDGKLVQITNDHSIAQALVDAGTMESCEAEDSRLKHILWNSVGAAGDGVHPEVHKVILHEADVVLMCSDGLHGVVEDAEIAQCLKASAKSSQQAGKQLVATANAAGGPDNITAVVARFAGAPAPSEVCGQECDAATVSAIADTVIQTAG